MNWLLFFRKWGALLVGLVACGAAGFLNFQAYVVGHQASAMGLASCNICRFFVLLLCWGAFQGTVDYVVGMPKREPGKMRILELIGMIFCFVGCFGCLPAIPAVPIVCIFAAGVGVKAVIRRRAELLCREGVVRVTSAFAIFSITWYLCSTTTEQAYRGFEDRVDETCGSKKLTDWAMEMIEAKRKEKVPGPQSIQQDNMPDWVSELLGRFEGVKGMQVMSEWDEPGVLLYTGSSGYHFRVAIVPGRAGKEGLPNWLVGLPDEWQKRNGIFIGTEGK